MKVLFIGGTGIISSACSRLCVARGIELFHLRRGQTSRPVPDAIQVLAGDIRDRESARRALGEHHFDVVVDWIAFTPAQIELDLALFRGRTHQYVFISSASAYQTPPSGLPVTESTPLDNPFWAYSRDKIACEERLLRAYREEKFPYTIVRHEDFARGLVGLLGNSRAIGEAVQITSDEWLSWNQIHEILAQAAGTRADLVHLPSSVIALHDPEWGASLLGDKTHSMIFDNAKVKRLVPGFRAEIPFSQGAREIMAYYDADPARRVVNPAQDALMDKLVAVAERAYQI